MILRTLEQKIEALVEGVFGRAFKSSVQPVELARKLTKEMDDHRTVSVSRVYVPNEYTVYLSTPDREQFEAYEASLKLELQEYLAQHARRESYVMLSPPVVVMTTDDDLAVGEFGIATRMIQQRARQDGPPVPSAEPAQTMVYRPTEPAADDPGAEVARETVALVDGSTKHEITKPVTVLGRSSGCDIRLDGPERLPPPRRAAAGRHVLVDRRSGIHERHRGERLARRAGQARARRHRHHRRDRARLHPRAAVIAAQVAVEEALLLLKIGFLVLLYLFLWKIVRTASRDLRTPQESFVLAPQQVRKATAPEKRAKGRLVVVTTAPRTATATAASSTSTRRPSRSGVGTRTTSRSTTSSHRPSTRGSRPVRTACGSRTSARRTAPSSTARASTARASSPPAT